MKELKVWPHLTIVAVVCAVLAGVGVGLWMRNERTASAEVVPNAARIQRVEGEVALNNSEAGKINRFQSVIASIPGLYDLDYYGYWRNIDGYGYAWSPRVDSGWMPYQTGYWYTDYPYGPTWVSNGTPAASAEAATAEAGAR
ncbi:MAG TPA: DUF6600 domain-containing protein [Pyrinomonadaceae bacterium]|nr:DUF6600 domain-containing protein [Pyrinomonadaceae bacterium]